MRNALALPRHLATVLRSTWPDIDFSPFQSPRNLVDPRSLTPHVYISIIEGNFPEGRGDRRVQQHQPQIAFDIYGFAKSQIADDDSFDVSAYETATNQTEAIAGAVYDLLMAADFDRRFEESTGLTYLDNYGTIYPIRLESTQGPDPEGSGIGISLVRLIFGIETIERPLDETPSGILSLQGTAVNTTTI